MSAATKKKHVSREVLEEYPEPVGDQSVVRIVGPRGNNLHEAESPDGSKFLCSMPTKFRKNVWIKRGDFVIVEPIEEGDKVKAEIIHILFAEQVRDLQKRNLWPQEFYLDNASPQAESILSDEQETDEESSEGTGEADIRCDEFGNIIEDESNKNDGDEGADEEER